MTDLKATPRQMGLTLAEAIRLAHDEDMPESPVTVAADGTVTIPPSILRSVFYPVLSGLAAREASGMFPQVDALWLPLMARLHEVCMAKALRQDRGDA